MVGKIERVLAIYIEDLQYQTMLISLALIQEKALSLYEDLKKELGDEEDVKEKLFKNSSRWFKRFKDRYVKLRFREIQAAPMHNLQKHSLIN